MNLSQKKVGIILSYLSLLISALVNIVNVPLFLHFIGVGEYGIYQTIGSLIAYFSILDFGLPATIVVFYSRCKASDDKIGMDNVLALCLRMYIVITMAILAAGVTLYFYLDTIYANSLGIDQLLSAKKIYIVFLINIACTLPFQILNAIITAYEKFIFLKGVSVLITVVQAIAMVCTVIKFPSALSIVIVQTIFNIIMVLLRYYYCSKVLKVRIKLHFFDKLLLKSIIKYSFYIFLNVIVDQLFWRSNLIILSIFGNSSEVAAYSITFQIAYNYMILSTAITGVFLPSITSMVSKGATNKELSDVFIKVGRVQFLLLSCVVTGFVLFGKQFISLWSIGKPGFENSYLMTLFLIIPLTIDLIQGLAQTILQAINKFYFRVIVFLGINIVNIGLSVLFSKVYGGIGCSIITGVSFLVFVAILNVFYAKSLQMNLKCFWSQILKMSVPVIICLFIGGLINNIRLYNPILEIIIKISLYIIVYSAIMWKFVMNTYEKNLFEKPLNKFKKAFIAHKIK